MEDERRETASRVSPAEVVGHCGFSPFPQGGTPTNYVQFGGGILGKPDGWGWPTAADYLKSVRAAGMSRACGAASGHGGLGSPSPAYPKPRFPLPRNWTSFPVYSTIRWLSGVRDSLPGTHVRSGIQRWAGRVGTICAGSPPRRGKLYATHMRSYFESAYSMPSERNRLVGEASGCRLQISHFQAAGRANWNCRGARTRRN